MRREERLLSQIDWYILASFFALTFIGWISIYAVGQGEGTRLFDLRAAHGRQFIWSAVSMVLGFAILTIDQKLFSRIAYPLFAAVLLTCILTAFIGPEIKGARSWLVVGSIRVQPSEFAKLATILALARYLSSVNANMSLTLTRLMSLAFMAIPAVIILLQDDLGSAIVFAGLFIMLYRANFPVSLVLTGIWIALLFVVTIMFGYDRVLIALAIIGAPVLYFMIRRFRQNRIRVYVVSAALVLSGLYSGLAVEGVYNHVLQDHQRVRINVLLGKQIDNRGAGYNQQQAKIALGSGGVTGKGYLQGSITRGKFVPEQSTDFIFSTVGEQFGFVGTFTFIALYIGLLIRIVLVAERQRSQFSLYFGYGVAALLFTHFVINIGMSIGLMPVVGIPLPFISYGGSAYLSFALMIFILLRLDASRTMIFR